MNDDKNLLGRVIALALIIGAACGARAIARGGSSCPFGGGFSCEMAVPPAIPSVEKMETAPVEKLDATDDGGHEDETKAPAVPSDKSE